MAKTLVDCIADIQATVTGLSDIGDPGHAVTDSLSDGIFASTEPASGDFTPDFSFRRGLHSIRCIVACKEDDYPRYRATIIQRVEDVFDALRADVTLGGTCDTITNLSYTYGSTKYGPYPVYGAIVTVGVKIQ